MNKLFVVAALVCSQFAFASSECPTTQSARELSKNTLLVLRVNERIEFDKNQFKLDFGHSNIRLQTQDAYRKSVIEAGTEFPLDLSKEITSTVGPRVSVKNKDLWYVWVKNDFDFETSTPAHLSITTNGKFEIRCDDDHPRVIKP